jgi:23S rRNA (adenine2503-C2)-methyltransferase
MTASHSRRYDYRRPELEALVATLGEPAYRGRQLFEGLYLRRHPLDDLTDLPRELRTRLADAIPLAFSVDAMQLADDDMTAKWLWRADDGAQVETVLMRYSSRATVCVSSQAGCAMGCTFCATGQAGFERHLDPGEIVEQVLRAAHASPQRVSNVVFMGMGEPLANYDNTLAAVRRIHDDVGISARRITVSTVGVAPAIRRLAGEDLPITLAVSLHASSDAEREQLVPLNRRYPIAEVLDAASEFAGANGRRVTFEYACIDGVNDSPGQAEILGRLLGAFPGVGGAHVNLIPLNPTDGFAGHASIPPRLKTFADRLQAHGVTATIRRNRGTDIAAACGQLRSRTAIPLDPPRSASMES